MILFMLIFMFIIILILMFLNFYISMFKMINREKNYPFECGFNCQSNSRLPFSTNFFLITLLFLIFDIEIILILPSIYLMKFNNLEFNYLLIFFILIMIVSLMIEWILSILDWIF